MIVEHGALPRCFVCGARDWRHAAGRARCSHCGLDVDPGRYDAPRHRAALARLLRPGPVYLPGLGFHAAGPFTMDGFTLRLAASAMPLGFEPASPEQAVALAHPHGGAARGHLVPLPPSGSPALPPPIALGGIARVEAAPSLARLLMSIAEPGAPLAIVVDADTDRRDEICRLLGAASERIRVLARPLHDDFAAQRCAVQDALGSMGARWALQLDDDETVDPAEMGILQALTGQADRQGIVSIGLRRANLVDGGRSDLWPDVQYRLNRTHVRYRGRVHERPDAGGWRRTTIALRGTITHRLDGARVRARSNGYEAMAKGGGRVGDEAALLRPFAP